MWLFGHAFASPKRGYDFGEPPSHETRRQQRHQLAGSRIGGRRATLCGIIAKTLCVAVDGG
jgi:hypothetical protein